MAKKKSNNKQVFLSPEKYIIERGRSLEIYECYVSKGWKQSGIAQILLARKHKNGNITSCVYLVDILCYGVKDSIFNHNQASWEYEEMKDSMFEMLEGEKVDYTLIHNIIYAAVEFAKEYELHPCKEYQQVTKYFLEEDTDEIPLMEIECGVDEKPSIYVGAENLIESRKTMAHFEKRFGEGVLNVMYDELEKDLDDPFNLINDEDEEDYLPFIPYVESMRYDNDQQKINDIEIVKQAVGEDGEDEEKIKEFVIAIEQLFYNELGLKEVNNLFSKYSDLFKVEIADEFADEFLSFGKALPATLANNEEELAKYYYFHETDIEDWINDWDKYKHIPIVSLELIAIELFEDNTDNCKRYVEHLKQNNPDYIFNPFLESLVNDACKENPFLLEIDKGTSISELFRLERPMQNTEFLIVCFAFHQYLLEKEIPEEVVVFWSYLFDVHYFAKTEKIELLMLMNKNLYVQRHVFKA